MCVSSISPNEKSGHAPALFATEREARQSLFSDLAGAWAPSFTLVSDFGVLEDELEVPPAALVSDFGALEVDGLEAPPAAPVLAPPLAVAPAEVVSLSDLVLDCCSMLFLFFFSALRLLLFVLGLSTSVLAPAAAPVSPFARSVVAPAAPRLPEVVSLEPVLAPTPAPAPDLSVLTSAPTFAPAEPCVVVP